VETGSPGGGVAFAARPLDSPILPGSLRARQSRSQSLKPRRARITSAGAVRVLAAVVVVGAASLGAGTSTSADREKASAAPVSPVITITSPRDSASYARRSRVLARFTCSAQGIGAPAITEPVASCKGTVGPGHALDTHSPGMHSFTVTATGAGGNTVTKTVHYTVWAYVNPLRMVAGLQASRIDMGVDYSGSGPILALGRAEVILATDRLAGPESCWGKTCVPPPGTMIIYRLLDGPFAGKYVYVVEHITITVKARQVVRAGEEIAILHEGSPNLEIGWATGRGAWTLAAARGHQCSCSDPGGWSSIEGRNFDTLLVWLGAPSGYITSIPARQHMPAGWPMLPAAATLSPARRRSPPPRAPLPRARRPGG